ncbi:hypothetical protein GA0070606_0211 [Micromonospora citrea]|uniref:Uncharacterized protein n=1 Tax=Micromonospora citrea TaxID=47855 RepID=A0A1C6TRH5_9ACTN|nr:DUF6461 domain-containing protein [Micromonospora citrea]SCL44268.1 hypothetical protein GA0070606_0211 [Micromonospora citrea]
MVEIPDAVLAELAGPVAAALPLVLTRIPPGPAAELGRLRAVADSDALPIPAFAGQRPAVARFRSGGAARPGDPSVRDALGSLPPLLTERLLGALELTVAELGLGTVPELAGLLDEPLTGKFGVATMSGQSEAVTGVAVLEQVRPGAVPLVAALARRLATHPRVGGLLTVGPDVTDERGVAAAHGAAQLALSVATAAVVLRGVGVRSWAMEPPAVLGVAIGTAVLLLREAPMPAGYAAALLDQVRAEYLLPLRSSGSAPVSGHRFALLEGSDVPQVDFGGNGLVVVVPGGAVIRAGVETGHVRISVSILDGPPPDVATGWEEIVEVSWRAAVGGASVLGPDASDAHLRHITPPWPGDYRLRVHARGRDDTDEGDTEHYELVVWQAPAAPEIVHARTDRLGHRLRGEPEPVRPERPETAYRWVRRSSLGEAATVTVATGTSVADVLRAFGADPGRPESLRAIGDDMMRRQSIDPWVAVLDLGDAVLAVEYNGWQGSTAPVLTRASVGGRAASMFWNVNAVTRLSFAEHGEVLLSVEPFGDLDAPPPVAPALADLDFADHRRGKPQQGLVAVRRFTGHGVTAEDLARIDAADIGFRIVPDLPPLYPRRPLPGRRLVGSLGPAVEAPAGLPEAERLAELSEPELRDLAWWVAEEAARHAGVGDDPDVVASIAARALTGPAHLRARRSQLDGGEHRWVWLALHRATNPDPVAAVTDSVDAARYAAGPHAANLLADARARIVGPAAR